MPTTMTSTAFRDLVDRVALDYLNRFDLIPEAKRAIQNAIRCYEANRYWFNTATTTTVCTAASTVLGVPSDFLALDRIELTINGAQYPLIEDTLGAIRQMNVTSNQNQPTHFAYYGDSFYLAAIPGSAYPVTFFYLKSLPMPTADSDTSAWLNEAQNLIAHTAALELCNNVIKADATTVRRHVQGAEAGLRELNTRNAMRLTTRLRPTQF